MSGRRHGFTLLEILVAIGLTAFVSLVSFQVFRQVQFTTERAAAVHQRDHTARIFLDRFERELMGTTLIVLPEDRERASFPWLFLGEDRLAAGHDADALRFVTQNPVRAPGSRGPGLRTVTYAVLDDPFGDRLDLYRAEQRLGHELVKAISLEGAQPVLEDVARFSLAYTGELALATGQLPDAATGELPLDSPGGLPLGSAGGLGPAASWDSTAAATLDALPLSVEVTLQLYEPGEDGERVPGVEHVRTIPLPIRPFEPGQPPEEQEGCATGPTVEECIARYQAELADHPQGGFVTNRVPPLANVCWNEERPSPELEALWDAFDQVVGTNSLEACPP